MTTLAGDTANSNVPTSSLVPDPHWMVMPGGPGSPSSRQALLGSHTRRTMPLCPQPPGTALPSSSLALPSSPSSSSSPSLHSVSSPSTRTLPRGAPEAERDPRVHGLHAPWGTRGATDGALPPTPTPPHWPFSQA